MNPVFPNGTRPRLSSPILRGWDWGFKSIGVLLSCRLRIFAPWSRLDAIQNNRLYFLKTPRCVQWNGPSILKICQALFMKFRSRILECYAICLQNCRPVAIEALSSLDNILLCLSSEVTALLSDLRLSHTIFTGNAMTQHRPLNSSMVYPVNSSMAEPVQPTNDGDPRMHPTPS